MNILSAAEAGLRTCAEETRFALPGHKARPGDAASVQATRSDTGARALPGVGLTPSTNPGPQHVADASETQGDPV